MLRILRILLVLYVAVVLQTTLAPSIQLLGVRPDFPFLIVLLVALREGAAGGALAGFVAGLFVDLGSAQTIGASSLANSIVGFAVGSMSNRLVRTSGLTRTVVAFAAVALRDQGVVAVRMADGFVDGLRLIGVYSLPGGLYSALFAAGVMWICERLIGWEKEKKRGVR